MSQGRSSCAGLPYPKNHKQAALPLTRDVAAALRQYRAPEALPSGRVFAGIIPRMDRFEKI